MSYKSKSRSEEPVSNTDVTDDFDGCRRREARWNDLVKHSQEVTYAKGQLDNKNDVMSRYVSAKITKRNYPRLTDIHMKDGGALPTPLHDFRPVTVSFRLQ